MSWWRHKTKILAPSYLGRTELFEWRCYAAEPILLSALAWVSIEYFNVSFMGPEPMNIWSWNMKVASALFSVTNSTSQWLKPSPWQNHSRKSLFNNWKLAITAARTEIVGSLRSACGTGTFCSCLTFLVLIEVEKLEWFVLSLGTWRWPQHSFQ